jgi:glycosyltransferase involved in cell wall biosynthesis
MQTIATTPVFPSTTACFREGGNLYNPNGYASLQKLLRHGNSGFQSSAIGRLGRIELIGDAEVAPRYSLIIRCFNEEKHIGRLLNGIKQQTEQDGEIILVDSGSTDSTVAIAERFEVKVVQIKPEEFSFGYALNVGCEAADGDYLIFASAHVYPLYKDWIEKLLVPFAEEKIALCYGRQVGDKTTKYAERQILRQWFPERSNFRQTIPFCNNANAAIRKDLWQELRYDESLTGLEDLDWAKRAISKGHTLAYTADAPIVHVHDETPGQTHNRYRREALALKQIMKSQTFTLFDFFRLLIGNVVSDWVHAFRDGDLYGNIASIPIFRFMQFSGTYRGFRHAGPIGAQLKQRFYYPRALKQPAPSNADRDDSLLIDYRSR